MTWTPAFTLLDFAFFFLLLMLLVIFLYSLKSPLWQEAYSQLSHSKVAIFSGLIMLIYLFIATLDSLRFTTPEDLKPFTIFDRILPKACLVKEISYSAPLSDHLLTPILSSDAAGRFFEMNPQLQNHWHLFGTDKIGRDVFYLSLKSIRTGFLVGGLSLTIAIPLAIFLGLLAGYYGGWIDDAIQFFYTVISSIPGVLLIAASILALQTRFETANELRLILLCLVLGGTGWIGLCRLLRAETLKLREMDYVQAAQLLGYRSPHLLSRYIFPNLFHLILITLALDFSGLVLVEAILSYIGIGLDASSYSWGTLINAARLELNRDPVVWWTLAAALSLMFLLVLAVNLFADELQKTLDPRRRYL